MTEHGPEVDEKNRIELRNARLKNWALVIGATATLVAAGTSLFSSLGIDKLIARRSGQQTAQTKGAYDALVASNSKLRGALGIAFRRIQALEADVKEVKDDHRMTMWMKMAAAAGRTPPMPPPLASAPPATSDQPGRVVLVHYHHQRTVLPGDRKRSRSSHGTNRKPPGSLDRVLRIPRPQPAGVSGGGVSAAGGRGGVVIGPNRGPA